MKIHTLLAAAALFGLVPATMSVAATMTEDECTAMLTKNDTTGDGSLSGKEADLFQDRIKGLDEKPKNAGILMKDEFMAACAKGTFDGLASN